MHHNSRVTEVNDPVRSLVESQEWGSSPCTGMSEGSHTTSVPSMGAVHRTAKHARREHEADPYMPHSDRFGINGHSMWVDIRNIFQLWRGELCPVKLRTGIPAHSPSFTDPPLPSLLSDALWPSFGGLYHPCHMPVSWVCWHLLPPWLFGSAFTPIQKVTLFLPLHMVLLRPTM